MKYLGVGYSVGMQKQDKCFSPFLQVALKVPRICAEVRDLSSVTASPGFPFSAPKVRDV